MKNLSYLLLFLFCAVISCTQTKNTEDSEQATEAETEPNTQDASELTYSDVVAMVYDDEGERIEWHGEEMPNDLTSFLAVSEGDPCGENDCGKRLTLSNSSDQSITVIMRGDYDIEGDQGYIPRKYVIEGGDNLLIGCSHLCYGGSSYPFPRTIVSSEYTESVSDVSVD